MPNPKSAHNATSASLQQSMSGRLVKYSPKKPEARNPDGAKAARHAANLLMANPGMKVDDAKRAACEKFKSRFLRNSEILAHVPKTNRKLRLALLKSPTRTLSGVSPIALMPPPAPCPGRCIYCPKGENAPQSYTGFEPTTMRAIQCNYSAKRQVLARLAQYSSQGHPTDKCHLIIMGGTFISSPRAKRHAFMLEAYNALNGKRSASLTGAMRMNETAPHRAIGVTFETRPDFGLEIHAKEMLSMGGTQVELGVQTLSDAVYRKVLRGHTVADVISSTRILRDYGFKIGYHMMPGLFATPKEDISHFKRLFADSYFRPDMLKIYPVLVMRGTVLYKMWEKGEFAPYTTDEAAEVIAQSTRFIPPYVRVPRIQRDIPSPLVSAGVKHSNLRQIVDARLSDMGQECNCIRCREIGSAKRKGKPHGRLSLRLHRLDYAASGGKETFLSFEDSEKRLLAGFLRLRNPSKGSESHSKGTALVRELHVYGSEVPIGERVKGKAQHTGLGARLLAEAERISKGEFGTDAISVLSGPGARGYYRKLGYSLDGYYMAKRL